MQKPAAPPILLAGLAFSLLLLLADSAVRLRAVGQATATHFSPAVPLATDTSTLSGYAGNQHNIVGPVRALDGYHWVMQTQMMLKDHQLRIRHTDYDGPLGGREVHWAVFVRYWTVPFAWAAAAIKGTTIRAEVEAVSPWVNTVLFVVVLIVLSIVIARRWGALAGTAFCVASVTVYLQYEMYSIGNYDHHGILSTCVLLTALCVGAGGAGWVRAGVDDQRALGKDAALWRWIPEMARARKWFIASGVAGGAGLWISAATQAPAIAALGVTALGGILLVRHPEGKAWRVEPTLWRVWGFAGGATSIALYLLEYFPSAPTLRLEVNHPLWALAWIGGGDLLCRLYRRVQSSERSGDAAWLALDAVLIAIVPLTVVFVPSSFGLRPGTLLFALHEQYIEEFRTIFWQLQRWTWAQINAAMTLIIVVVAIPAVALIRSRAMALPIRSVMLAVTGPAIAFTLLGVREVRWIAVATSLWIGVLITLCAIATISSDKWNSALAKKIAAGGVVSLILALLPVLLLRDAFPPRALNAGLGLVTVAVAVVASLAVMRGLLTYWTDARLRLAGVCAGLVILPHPVATAFNWTVYGLNYHVTPEDVAQLVSRDVAQSLRARLGDERGTVLGGPTTSSWLTYFGGTKSVATLYWENSAGITLASEIFGQTPDSARKLIDANGITHIVIFSWDQEAIDYSRIHSSTMRYSAGEQSLGKLILGRKHVTWLRPVPYEMPTVPYQQNPWVIILEVAPGQSTEESLVRAAQYELASGRIDEGITSLRNALQTHPDYLPALIQMANVEAGSPDQTEFRRLMGVIRQQWRDTTTLAYEDNVFLAIAGDIAGDSVMTRAAISRALATADEQNVRRLAPNSVAMRFAELREQYRAQPGR